MRFLAVLFALAFIAPAHAEDEFGARFTNEAPSALGTYEVADMDMIAQGLQDIMPAGGDEEPVVNTTPETQPAITETPVETQPAE